MRKVVHCDVILLYMDSGPFESISEHRPPQRLVAWIILEHRGVHEFLEDFLDHEAAFTGQVEECEIFLEKPGTVGREED